MLEVLWKTRYARRRARFGVTAGTGRSHSVQCNLAKQGTACWLQDAMAVDDGIRECRFRTARLFTHVRLTGAAHLTQRRVVDGTLCQQSSCSPLTRRPMRKAWPRALRRGCLEIARRRLSFMMATERRLVGQRMALILQRAAEQLASSRPIGSVQQVNVWTPTGIITL